MRTALPVIAALATLVAATTALAQPLTYGDFERQVARAERRMERCPGISRVETAALRYQIRSLRSLGRDFRASGLTRRESADLQGRVRFLNSAIRGECYDRDSVQGYPGDPTIGW